jgi:hypothetical protein
MQQARVRSCAAGGSALRAGGLAELEAHGRDAALSYYNACISLDEGQWAAGVLCDDFKAARSFAWAFPCYFRACRPRHQRVACCGLSMHTWSRPEGALHVLGETVTVMLLGMDCMAPVASSGCKLAESSGPVA